MKISNICTYINFCGDYGKSGSIAFLEAILKASNIIVGVFEGRLGEGLEDYRNFARVNGKAMTKKYYKEHEHRIEGTIKEKEWKLAESYFKEQNCQVVLIKYGSQVESQFSFEPKQVEQARIELHKCLISYQEFSYKQFRQLRISLFGEFQIENACLALEAVQVLRTHGFVIQDKDISKGLLACKNPKSMYLLGKQPYLVLDSGRKEEAYAAVEDCMEKFFSTRSLILIVAATKDSDYETLTVSKLVQRASHVLTLSPQNEPNPLDAYVLAEKILPYHESVSNVGSVQEALEISHLLAARSDVILYVGPKSSLEEIIKLYKNKVR